MKQFISQLWWCGELALASVKGQRILLNIYNSDGWVQSVWCKYGAHVALVQRDIRNDKEK